MITLDKLIEYENCHGFFDGFYQQKIKKGTNISNEDDWLLIRDLTENIKLVVGGKTSKGFTKKINESVIQNCDNVETISKIREIAKIDWV